MCRTRLNLKRGGRGPLELREVRREADLTGGLWRDPDVERQRGGGPGRRGDDEEPDRVRRGRVGRDGDVEADRRRLVGRGLDAVDVKPPPKRVAVQPVGVLLTVRPTRSLVGDSIVRSKLTFVPGATATAGYGVVSVSVSAAPAVAPRQGHEQDHESARIDATKRCVRRPIVIDPPACDDQDDEVCEPGGCRINLWRVKTCECSAFADGPVARAVGQDEAFADDRMDRQRDPQSSDERQDDLLRPPGAEFRVEPGPDDRSRSAVRVHHLDVGQQRPQVVGARGLPPWALARMDRSSSNDSAAARRRRVVVPPTVTR